MVVCKSADRIYGRQRQVSIKYYILDSFQGGVILLCQRVLEKKPISN